MASPLISYCGLYCGACSFKVAFETQDKVHISDMPKHYDQFKNNPLEDCPGCRLENNCGECKIRDCAIERNVDYCIQCEMYPCKLIDAFAHDGKPHHEEVLHNFELLKKKGENEWLRIMRNKWTCQKCKSQKSWYHTQCKCK